MTSIDSETKSCPPEGPRQEISLGCNTNISPGESRRVRRKADLILLPILGFCYFLQFLDKQTLSYASLPGMIETIPARHAVLMDNVNVLLWIYALVVPYLVPLYPFADWKLPLVWGPAHGSSLNTPPSAVDRAEGAINYYEAAFPGML
jgi:hypothetical protein